MIAGFRSLRSAKRVAAALGLACLLGGCGFVPPTPLHGAPIDPNPSATGIVYYGEILGEGLGIGAIGIRQADRGDVQTSERAVIVLPAGSYVFELKHPTGETMVTELVDADGNYFSVWEEVFETTTLDVSVLPGQCYRLFRIGDASEKQYGYEDYWPADREDLASYCPDSRR